MSYIYIHCPATFWSRAIMRCRTCRKRRRVVVMHQAWYDPVCYCTGCGDSPHERYQFKTISRQRQRKIALAKERWNRATTHREAVRAMCANELETDGTG